MLISHEDRRHYRDTISRLGDLIKTTEKISRGTQEATPSVAKLLHTLTQSSDLHTQFKALEAMRDEVQEGYEEKEDDVLHGCGYGAIQ